MDGMDAEAIGMKLDDICQKLFKKVIPLGVCAFNEWQGYGISDKVNLLDRLVETKWVLSVREEKLKKEIESLKKKQRNDEEARRRDLEEDRSGFNKMYHLWVDAECKSRDLIKRVDELEKENSYLKEELGVYEYNKKGQKGNQNARRKDIKEEDVYMLVKSGMSITKVAEKYHASRQTIRKYYLAGENMYSEYE